MDNTNYVPRSFRYFRAISSSARLYQETDPVGTRVHIPGVSIATPRALPIVTSRKIQFPNPYREPKQAWLESLSQIEDEKLGLIDLHPDIFGAYPRIDILQRNIKWQQMYRRIDYNYTPSRGELKGSNRKIYAQKGGGRARHKNKKSPLFPKGAKALGPRGPKSYFYMPHNAERIMGLCSALSVKYAQGYLQIVESLDIPTDDSGYITDLIDTRYWGFSCLMVNHTDIMPDNIFAALQDLPHVNLMPVYGLNVYSMLKHETLVLTLGAVEHLERKLLYHLHKTASNSQKYTYERRYDQT